MRIISWKLVLVLQLVLGSAQCQRMKKSKCLNPPRTAKKVESNIKDCQDEVRNKLVTEAFGIIRDQISHGDTGSVSDEQFHLLSTSSNNENAYYDYLEEPHDEKNQGDSSQSSAKDRWSLRRRSMGVKYPILKRRSMEIYHPTLVPFEDKRLAGCLLHCVYAKNNAIDHLGWPTLDGLVDFYSEGVNEHGFFMATLRAVDLCLKATTHKYHINRNKLPEKGESCDLAFDVFDCISDQITGYCLDHYRQ